jgi:hypothetical protein
MTNETSPADLPPWRAGHPRFRRVAFAPLWLACVLVLSLGIAAAAYLMTRRPIVVETVAPAPTPAELSPEVVRRAEALRALNGALADQIDALRQQIEQPRCPPGTAVESTGGVGKSSFDEGASQSPDLSASSPRSAGGPR